MGAVGARIHDIRGKIKPLAGSLLSEWGIVALVVLTSLAAFGLGRLSALVEARPLLTVAQATTVDEPRLTVGGLLVASRYGSVYYYPWCSGAGKISPANERWFGSEKEAQAAGYRPAKNCKGLTAEGE